MSVMIQDFCNPVLFFFPLTTLFPPSEDLAVCVRCRRKMPDDVKIVDDPNFKPKPDSTEVLASKKALRLARLPGKSRRRGGNPDEPVI